MAGHHKFFAALEWGAGGAGTQEETVLGREASVLGQLCIKLDWRLLKESNFLAHAH